MISDNTVHCTQSTVYSHSDSYNGEVGRQGGSGDRGCFRHWCSSHCPSGEARADCGGSGYTGGQSQGMIMM